MRPAHRVTTITGLVCSKPKLRDASRSAFRMSSRLKARVLIPDDNAFAPSGGRANAPMQVLRQTRVSRKAGLGDVPPGLLRLFLSFVTLLTLQELSHTISSNLAQLKYEIKNKGFTGFSAKIWINVFFYGCLVGKTFHSTDNLGHDDGHDD